MHVRCTFGALAVRLRCTCGALAVHCGCTRGARAVHLRCACCAPLFFKNCVNLLVHMRCAAYALACHLGAVLLRFSFLVQAIDFVFTLCSPRAHRGCTCGSRLAHLWWTLGSLVVLWRFRCGSHLVQLRCACRFTVGSPFVYLRFAFCSVAFLSFVPF